MGRGAKGVVRCFITVCSLTLFYKSTLYKNTEARFAQNIRTSLEHAQLQMRNLKKTIRILQFMSCKQNKTTVPTIF